MADLPKKGEGSAKDKPPQHTRSVPFYQLFKYADRTDWILMVLGTAGALANGAAWPIFAVIFSRFINSFGDYQQGRSTNKQFEEDINSLAASFAYLALGSLITSYFEAGVWMLTGNRQANRIRGLYLRAVLRQNVAFFDTQGNTGGLLSALNADTHDIQGAMSEKLGAFLHNVSTFVTGLIVAFVAGWDMTLLMMASIPLLAALGDMISKINTVVAGDASKAYSDASGLVTQMLGQIRTVVSFGQEQRAVQDYSQALEAPYQQGLRMSVFQGVAFGGMHLVEYCTWAGALYYGAWRISKEKYDGGDVLNVMIAVLMGGFALGQTFPLLHYFDAGRAAAGRVFEVLDRKPTIDVDADGEVLPAVKGCLEFKAVTFSYPARSDVVVFNEFTLTVPAGKTVALVGHSGSGKSTAVQLIQRFYDPASGQVLLDGVDLRKLKLTWLRQQMGLVSQEPTLFATDIGTNIGMGLEGATHEQIVAAATAANAHKFISALPLGYKTNVGERGLQLSGGQKQRIAIARAILKNPRIMLLDEATSALDTESERLVQDALDRLVVGRTTVVVAHRLSTIQNADLIAVVGGGKIVEMGSHKELLQDDQGAYTTLVKIQMQAMESNDPEAAKPSAAGGIHTVESLQNLEAADNPATRQLSAQPEGIELVVHKMASTQIAQQEAAATVTVDLADRKDPKAAEEEKDAPKVPFSRLFGIVKDKWPLFITGTIGAIVGGGVTPTFALMLATIINTFYPQLQEGNSAEARAFNRHQFNRMLDKAQFYSGMMIIIGLGSVIAHVMLHASFGIVGQTLAKRIREMLFGNLMYMDIGYFDMPKHTSGILANILSEDAGLVRGAVGDTIALLSENISTLAVGYIIAFFFDWRMTLLVTGVLPLLISSLVIYFKAISGAMGGSADRLYADANQMVVDAFGSIRVIQSFNLQDRMCVLYKDLMKPGAKVMQKTSHYTGLAMGYSNGTAFAIYALIIWFGCWEVRHGKTKFEDMLKAFLCVLMAAIGIGQAQVGFPDIAKAGGAVQRVFPIIDRQSRISAREQGGVTIMNTDSAQGDLEFRNITFSYPSRPSVVIFSDFSLTIKARNQVALVGESGSGKSTVVALLQRFYDPQEGAVLMGGTDLRQFNLHWLRSQMAMVSQEPLLFSSSIIDNIRYGRPDASEEDVRKAAEAANALSFIEALPDGLHTTVGERGMQLSGGQKQRIAIARAVLKNASILLLDEATSALDASSEQVVQEALDRIMPGRTCVTIAHRLSTVRNAHTIAFVYRGKILEQGTHDELMNRPDGGYARLVTAQMRGR